MLVPEPPQSGTEVSGGWGAPETGARGRDERFTETVQDRGRGPTWPGLDPDYRSRARWRADPGRDAHGPPRHRRVPAHAGGHHCARHAISDAEPSVFLLRPLSHQTEARCHDLNAGSPQKSC